MISELSLCLTNEECEWIARFCQRAIKLSEMNSDNPGMKIFDPEFQENKSKALILKTKMENALNATK